MVVKKFSVEWFVAVLSVISITGFAVTRSSTLAIPLLQETPDVDTQIDDAGDSVPPAESWWAQPYATINKVSTRADRLRQQLSQDVDQTERLFKANSGERSTTRRNKKYKLSFYDCISLYCGERMGSERGQCILRFCHRTK